VIATITGARVWQRARLAASRVDTCVRAGAGRHRRRPLAWLPRSDFSSATVAVPASTSSLLWLTSDGPSGGEVVAAFGRKARGARPVAGCCCSHRRRRARQAASACGRPGVRVRASTQPPRATLLLYLGERHGRAVPTWGLRLRRADAAVSAGAATALLLVPSERVVGRRSGCPNALPSGTRAAGPRERRRNGPRGTSSCVNRQASRGEGISSIIPCVIASLTAQQSAPRRSTQTGQSQRGRIPVRRPRPAPAASW